MMVMMPSIKVVVYIISLSIDYTFSNIVSMSPVLQVGDLETEVETEQRGGVDAVKRVCKYERRVKELTYKVRETPAHTLTHTHTHTNTHA